MACNKYSSDVLCCVTGFYMLIYIHNNEATNDPFYLGSVILQGRSDTCTLVENALQENAGSIMEEPENAII